MSTKKKVFLKRVCHSLVKQENTNMTERVCYVTAFLDLQRESWSHFSRSIDSYIDSFLPFLSLWKKCNQSRNVLVAFIDEKHYDRIRSLVKGDMSIAVIPIDRNFLKRNIPIWNRLDREREIMKDERFMNLIKHRRYCPETNNPEYTLMNHAKIDFVNYARKEIAFVCEYFAWFDFGYFKNEESIPKSLLDISLLDSNKINYTLVNPLDEQDKDVMHTMLHAPERIGGFFFFGNAAVLEEYQKLYHEVHDAMQKCWLVDDDQHIALRCYYARPDLFTLHNLGGWHRAFTHFQEKVTMLSLTEIMNKHGSDKGSGHHNYTAFYSTLFEKRRFDKISLLEIGIGTINPCILSSMCGAKDYKPGSSLRAWKEYFPNGQIYGCDIDKDILFEEDRIQTFYVDQTDVQSLYSNIVQRDEMFDIIIDDGLHLFPVNYNVFKTIFCKLKQDGIYVIEDVMNFDQNVLNDPFLKNLQFDYIPLPNPNNKHDNNLIVVSRKV
jgi:hypothetical protein